MQCILRVRQQQSPFSILCHARCMGSASSGLSLFAGGFGISAAKEKMPFSYSMADSPPRSSRMRWMAGRPKPCSAGGTFVVGMEPSFTMTCREELRTERKRLSSRMREHSNVFSPVYFSQASTALSSRLVSRTTRASDGRLREERSLTRRKISMPFSFARRYFSFRTTSTTG